MADSRRWRGARAAGETRPGSASQRRAARRGWRGPSDGLAGEHGRSPRAWSAENVVRRRRPKRKQRIGGSDPRRRARRFASPNQTPAVATANAAGSDLRLVRINFRRLSAVSDDLSKSSNTVSGGQRSAAAGKPSGPRMRGRSPVSAATLPGGTLSFAVLSGRSAWWLPLRDPVSFVRRRAGSCRCANVRWRNHARITNRSIY